MLYVTQSPGLDPGRWRHTMASRLLRRQVMTLTDSAAERVRATDRGRRQAGGRVEGRRQERRLRRHVLYDGTCRGRQSARRNRRGQGRAASDRPKGGAVPARLADGLQGRSPVGEPSRSPIPTRRRPAVAARASRSRRRAPRPSTCRLEKSRVDADGVKRLFEPFGEVTVKRMFGGAGDYAEGCASQSSILAPSDKRPRPGGRPAPMGLARARGGAARG